MLLMRQKTIFTISVLVILVLIFFLLRIFGTQNSGTNLLPIFQEKVPKTNLDGIQYGDLNAIVSQPVSQLERIDWKKSENLFTIPFNSVEHDKSNSSKSYDEEFTIILLTHWKRTSEVISSLEHLTGLPRLSKVLVIWNGEKPPDSNLKWPTVNFPYKILTNGRNSLNNRFLPLEIIETEAILSMDDDMFPSHESLLFAFRVWQEFRDRIVGFPGRGVVWKGGRWEYDPHPCVISLVLTGLAFFHKKYMNLYTYEMPEVIRQRVDNLTNCEDIAMNFLVSHVTQKAPIKVTPTNEWLCPKCDREEKGKDPLWKIPTHFEERDNCINFFTEVYGYLPLFKSEYRLDDIFENVAPICFRINKNNDSFESIYIFRHPALVLFIVAFLGLIILLKFCYNPQHNKHNTYRDYW